MSAQTISLRLPEEEVAILNLLSDRERRTKTQIIREALQPLFWKVLDEPERITLSNTEFQALLGKLFKNPCSQAELNKIVPFGFSLQHQKMVFFLPSK